MQNPNMSYDKVVETLFDSEGNPIIIRQGQTYSIKTKFEKGNAYIDAKVFTDDEGKIINELVNDMVYADAEIANLKHINEKVKKENQALNSAINEMINQGFISYEQAVKIFSEANTEVISSKNETGKSK